MYIGPRYKFRRQESYFTFGAAAKTSLEQPSSYFLKFSMNDLAKASYLTMYSSLFFQELIGFKISDGTPSHSVGICLEHANTSLKFIYRNRITIYTFSNGFSIG